MTFSQDFDATDDPFELGGRRSGLLRLRSLGKCNHEERHSQRDDAHDVGARGYPQTVHG
jgi:hypothetical protein